ncbi:lachesin-like isoform X1 [Macrobrachium rosenbergii]|uniref:lachesin-like isoform X1 n=1 Tax=Macrobrachium rosenbergii TaxID=79674 RepID=UPI0034D44E34
MMSIKWMTALPVICYSINFLSGTTQLQGVRIHSRYAPREDERVALDTSLFLRESHYGLPIQTVTVNVGQTARLTCFVQTPGDYKVAWMKKVTNIVLSMGEAVIIRDPRMSVQREQRSTWILTITNVTIKDHGYYTCNINTLPPTSIHGFLNVVEPPVLDDKDEGLWVMEGMKAVLSCSAHGTPTPSYKWFREDYSRIRLNSSTYVQSWEKRKLILEHVNHQTAGGYICIASNGYPPSKSKRVFLNVYFAPKVRGPGSQIWAHLGQTVSLTCLYAAFPAPNVMWILENHLGLRRLTEEYFTNTIQDGHPPYTHNMTLQIRKLTPGDFGRYTCSIRNKEGQGSYTTTLREITTTIAPPPTSSTITTIGAYTTTLMTHLYNSLGGAPTSSRSHTTYDDDTVNLSAPLIINLTPDVYRETTNRSRCLQACLILATLLFLMAG